MPNQHIFISYARRDNEYVKRLIKDLADKNMPVRIYKLGLKTGDASWERAIRQAITDCSAVIWVVSPASYDSPYVHDEIAIARNQKRPIYPLWADGTDWLSCVPLGMGETQYADGRGNNYAPGLEQLLLALNGAKPELAVPVPAAPTLNYRDLKCNELN